MKDARYRFGFIGAGKLAGSVIRGLLLKKFCAPSDIIASEPNETVRVTLQNDLGVSLAANNAEVAHQADVIFLGLKPQVVLPVLRELADTISNTLVVSFAAGVRTASMEAVSPARILRVITNTPSTIGRAATAFAAGTRTTRKDREKVLEIFSAIGFAIEIEEDGIDAVTALAGSGPAFVYAMIEALAQGGTKSGLSEDAALKLAAQTALGAADLLLTSGKSPAELIQMVVTPGGTTAAGLRVMEDRKTTDSLSAAVEAATRRGQEMAREFTSSPAEP